MKRLLVLLIVAATGVLLVTTAARAQSSWEDPSQWQPSYDDPAAPDGSVVGPSSAPAVDPQFGEQGPALPATATAGADEYQYSTATSSPAPTEKPAATESTARTHESRMESIENIDEETTTTGQVKAARAEPEQGSSVAPVGVVGVVLALVAAGFAARKFFKI